MSWWCSAGKPAAAVGDVVVVVVVANRESGSISTKHRNARSDDLHTDTTIIATPMAIILLFLFHSFHAHKHASFNGDKSGDGDFSGEENRA